MSKLVVVALGGNALLRSNQKGTYQEQTRLMFYLYYSYRELMTVHLPHRLKKSLTIESFLLESCIFSSRSLIKHYSFLEY